MSAFVTLSIFQSQVCATDWCKVLLVSQGATALGHFIYNEYGYGGYCNDLMRGLCFLSTVEAFAHLLNGKACTELRGEISNSRSTLCHACQAKQKVSNSALSQVINNRA